MKIARLVAESELRPGDAVLVHYYNPDIVQEGISIVEHGTVEHCVCVVDGLDIVEATTIGIIQSNLYNYMRGNCRLTIKRVKPMLGRLEKSQVRDYWYGCVGEIYDLGMILGIFFISVIRNVIAHFSKPAGRWCLRHVRNAFASKDKTTCAELWLRGIRQYRPEIMRGYPAENCTPEIIMRDEKLQTVAVWDRPELVGL